MNALFWIIFGGLVGWMASIIMHTDAQQGVAINVIVGIVGASLGSWIVGTAGMGGANSFTLYSFAVALLGAVALIGIVRAIRRA